MLSTLASIFGSGAIGTLLGSLTGIAKGWLESKERLANAKITLQRDRMEYDHALAMNKHQLAMQTAGAEIALKQSEQETEAEMTGANQMAMGRALSAEFSNLKTTEGMDNYRASVRPNVTYLLLALFVSLLLWSFFTYKTLITANQGLSIMLMLIDALIFMVTSCVKFYFVARRNDKPHR